MENDDATLTRNVSGWLYNLLCQPIPVGADQAENVVAAKQWLAQVNQGMRPVGAPSLEGAANESVAQPSD